MAMGNFQEQLENVTIHHVVARATDLGVQACAKEELKALQIYIYKGASACGSAVWVITDVLHGNFLSAVVDGNNDELSLAHTFRCDNTGKLSLVA